MPKCAWCKKEFEEARYPNVQDFILSFEVGTTSEDTGPNVSGYEIEEMCTECAWKLKGKLIELGIDITSIDT